MMNMCYGIVLFIGLLFVAEGLALADPVIPRDAEGISNPQSAFSIPQSALRHRLDLTRTAQAAWGLDAPVAAFAAQIHQESGWNPQAVSYVGAKGMAQFMPGTARWWCDLNQLSAIECQPTNPTWAMRALVGYDLWLYQRVHGNSEFDQMWAALRAYNGGLGSWQKEAQIAGSFDRVTVDAACGHARRHIRFCAENLGYPQRILVDLQPRYQGWGRGVFLPVESVGVQPRNPGWGRGALHTWSKAS